MICWYCHWGWAKPVAEIYLRALKDLDGYDSPLLYGPGHVVWCDENFDLAESCLENFDQYKYEYTQEELAIVRRSLEELAQIPMDDREIIPDDYDGENPENFPPTVPVLHIDHPYEEE